MFGCFQEAPWPKDSQCCQNVTLLIAASLRFIPIFSPLIFKDSVTEMPLATHWESDHSMMTLTYFSVPAHVCLTALPPEPWSFPASWAQSKDRGYLIVGIESGLPSFFSQSQIRFEYKLLRFYFLVFLFSAVILTKLLCCGKMGNSPRHQSIQKWGGAYCNSSSDFGVKFSWMVEKLDIYI